MPFRYPLQSILRLRFSLERQAEQLLFKISGQVLRLRTEIEELERGELARKRFGLQEVAEGSFGALLQYHQDCEFSVLEKRQVLLHQLQAAELQRREQLSLYQQARQKREILEQVREKQKALYEMELLRRDQQRADEAFLLRSHFEDQD